MINLIRLQDEQVSYQGTQEVKRRTREGSLKRHEDPVPKRMEAQNKPRKQETMAEKQQRKSSHKQTAEPPPGMARVQQA